MPLGHQVYMLLPSHSSSSHFAAAVSKKHAPRDFCNMQEHLQRQQRREEERRQEQEQAVRAAERARAAREAPVPERYVPRGASPSRYDYSSESDDLPLPSLPPARNSRRLASQIASRPVEAAPAAAAAMPSRRSRSLSPDPVRTAVNHAEPPRHTLVPSPPRRARPNRSPSPPPKRQRREVSGTDHKRSSQLAGDEYRNHDGYRSRNGSRSDAYPADRHDTERDKRHDAAAVYGDRPGHSSKTESVRQPDRNSGRDIGRAPYGDRHYGDRDRTRESDRGWYDDRGRERSQHNGDRREERCSRLRDSAGRHASPAVRYDVHHVNVTNRHAHSRC